MRKISAESLIDLAIATLRSEIQPAIPSDKRYALAMTIRALDVARREVLGEPEAEAWALLDDIYDDGEGSLAMLSSDIRAGKITDETHPSLREGLERLLVGELGIRNPAALKARAVEQAGGQG